METTATIYTNGQAEQAATYGERVGRNTARGNTMIADGQRLAFTRYLGSIEATSMAVEALWAQFELAAVVAFNRELADD